MRRWIPAWPRAVWGVLAFALLYRLVLVFRGGQMFYPDEWRYYASVELLHHAVHGGVGEAWRELLARPAHIGFVFLGLIPAFAQGLLRVVAGINPESCWWIPAGFIALCSTACLALVYALARRLGAGREESLLALLLAAGSASLARYGRHLFPYDPSLMLGLFGLWVGLGRPSTPARSFVAGLLASGCFLVYNGYWPLAGLALVAHVLWRMDNGRGLLRRGVWAFIGLILPIALLVAAAAAAGGNLIEGLREHSGSLIGGTIAEGWKIAFLYLWHSEHAWLPVALAGSAVSLLAGRPAAGRLWAALAAALYLQQWVGAHVLHQWPVFGRLARPMIPFLALAAAHGAARFLLPGRARGLFLLAGILGAFNLVAPLREQFPSDWIPRFRAQYPGDLRAMNTNLGPVEHHLDPELRNPAARFVFVNYRLIKPVEGYEAPPPGRILWQRPHPAQFPYNHYNGLWAHEREWLRREDFSMRLIDTRPEQAP